jgi:hypothetical protein
MSRPICDTMEEFFPSHSADPHGAFLAEGASWLVNIGSGLLKLKEIAIDAAAFCNTWTLKSANGYYLEVLALLRVLWRSNWGGNVLFWSPSKLASMRSPCRCRSSYARGSQPIDTDNLNKLFASLMRDELDIRKYGNMLRHVAIHRNKPHGIVAFRSSVQTHCPPNASHIYNSKKENPCLKASKRFELDNAQCTRMVKPSPNLLDLPTAIRQRIFDHVLVHNNPIHVYMRRKGTYKSPGLLYANSAISWAEYKRYFTSHDFILHFERHTSQLFNLNALYCWMSTCPPLWLRLPWAAEDSMTRYKGRNVKSLCLDFKPLDGDDITFESIRINVAALVRFGAAMGHPGTCVPIRMRIFLRLENGSEGIMEEIFLSVSGLRALALDALRKLREAVTSIKNDNAVDIVVNGYGEPVGYVYYGCTDVLQLPEVAMGL